MPRALRICLTLLGPAPIGVSSALFVLLVSTLFENPANFLDFMGEIGRFFVSIDVSLFDCLAVFVAAYGFAGLPSLVYMACIELFISEGMDPRGWKLVAVSTFLGLISGLALGTVASLGIIHFTILGTWVGFVVGLLIKFMPERISFRRRKKRKHPREIIYD